MTSSNPVDRVRAAAELADHANEIRRLGRRVVEDVIAIGHHLIAAKALCGHGHWLEWVKDELKWDESSAKRYMRVAEASKSRNLSDLSVPVSAIFLLTAPSTPPEAIDEVAARIARGGRLKLSDVAEVVGEIKVKTTYTDYTIKGHGGVVSEEPAFPAAPPIVDERPEAEARSSTITSADLQEKRTRSTAQAILQCLYAIECALARQPDVDGIVAVLTDAERQQLREGIEIVDRLKAALGAPEPDDPSNVVRLRR
jgi:hypothetical protein